MLRHLRYLDVLNDQTMKSWKIFSFSPFLVMQFRNLEPGILVSIVCKMWAKKSCSTNKLVFCIRQIFLAHILQTTLTNIPGSMFWNCITSRGLKENNFLIYIFFKYKTIVRSSAWSFCHLDPNPCSVHCARYSKSSSIE